MGFKCVDFLDCVVINCEVIRIIAMSSNFLNTLYILSDFRLDHDKQMKRFINITDSRYFGGHFENMQIRT